METNGLDMSPRRCLRADLHVHTRYSVLDAFRLLSARDSYSEPDTVYRIAKARGMDLVTITDHDTIDGCLELLCSEGDLPDFFISEEVSTLDPRTGFRFHLGLYGIDERVHREVQYLREDLSQLLAYLEQEKIPFSLNHLGASLVGRRPAGSALLHLLSRFPLLETRNGAQSTLSNQWAGSMADRMESRGLTMGRTGGSDAHTPLRIGWTWTEARAQGREAFLSSLRSREVSPGGASIQVGPLLRDVYRTVWDYYSDLVHNRHQHFTPVSRRKATACALASLPLHLMALPVAGTAFRYARIHGAVRRMVREMERDSSSPPIEAPARQGVRSFAAPRCTTRSAATAWMSEAGSEEA